MAVSHHFSELVEPWCEVLLIDLSPCGMDWVRGSSDGLFDGWYRLGCELTVDDGLIPMIVVGIEDVIGGRGSVIRGGSSWTNVGAVGDNKVVPEIKVKRGCGWCMCWPPVPSIIVIIGDRGNGVVWVACAQLVLYALLSELVL